jgi:hypothetical protein
VTYRDPGTAATRAGAHGCSEIYGVWEWDMETYGDSGIWGTLSLSIYIHIYSFIILEYVDGEDLVG